MSMLRMLTALTQMAYRARSLRIAVLPENAIIWSVASNRS